MNLRITISLIALVAISAFAFPTTARSQERFTREHTSTLTDRYNDADAAVLAKQIETTDPGDEDDLGSTTYEIVQIGRSAITSLAKGMRITVPSKQAGKKGQFALVLATGASLEKLNWKVPTEINARRYNYLAHAPVSGDGAQARLSYFISRLEDADDTIATDAFAQVANAPTRDLMSLASRLPRESLRSWLHDPDLRQNRLGLYALMLGLCGDEDDAEEFYDRIVEPIDDFRSGIDEMITGYLLLTGKDGLEKIDRLKLADPKCIFSETYAAMQALRFLWNYGDGRIPTERLKMSMRLLLDRPEVSDLVIADLMRWKDWTVQDRVRNLYGVKEYNIPSVNRAIVRYLIASTKDVPVAGDEESGKHVAAGARYLEELRELDPKTVNEAERFFFLK